MYKNHFFWSLFIIGLTSIYREGFEVVLFPSIFTLRSGFCNYFFQGVLIGFGLTVIVGVLTFLAQKNDYLIKMLVFTGALLVAVLAVMVGETVQEMQLAGWMSTTPIKGLSIPDWLQVWFCVFPNVEGLSFQALAVVYVLGSYFCTTLYHKEKKQSRKKSLQKPGN
ncbi:hypothetical protein GCM10020331_004890 [Ectobacillus funiculus]